MKFLSARRTLSAGIVAAASVAAFALPSAASAALPEHCKGSNTEGAGSSFQLEAEEIWTGKKGGGGFDVNSSGCVGGPTIGYRSVGSGAGFNEWATAHKYGAVGFVGTDNTVNPSEKATIEGQVDAGKSSKVGTVPVEQGAVAIVINLPENCTATSSVASGRLAMNQSTLEKIYTGEVTTWAEIASQPNTGNKIEGAGCNTATKITPIVRKDSSGTTHIFKKFLFNNDSRSFETECTGTKLTWSEAAEGTVCASETALKWNQEWPLHEGSTVVKHATETTNTGVLKEVAAIPGSIGYADLSQARNPANGGFTGQSPQRFWAELESSQKLKGSEVKSRKYQDPATNGDVAGSAESNCKKAEYGNGAEAFPPPVTAAWNNVSVKKESKTYALCGLTYMLVLSNYAAYNEKGSGNAAEARTVKDYLAYVVGKKGGQAEVKGHDFAALPKALGKETSEGVELIED